MFHDVPDVMLEQLQNCHLKWEMVKILINFHLKIFKTKTLKIHYYYFDF